MSYLAAAFLGLVQGVAEFLPISSSGHLAIFQDFFGIEGADMFFDVLLHLATLVAVIVAYWKDVKHLFFQCFGVIGIGPARGKTTPRNRDDRRMVLFIILATLPLFLILPIKDKVESLYQYPIFIGCALLVTGLILFLSDRFGKGNRKEQDGTALDAVLIGCAQAVATVPGLSRSGCTIAAGMGRGFGREYAVRFSFLMSIPAVLGANILSFIDAVKTGINTALLPAYLLGMVVAGVSGYLSIRLLKYIASRGTFGGFAYYCWGAGIVTLILSMIA